jgi:hypothetical protein
MSISDSAFAPAPAASIPSSALLSAALAGLVALAPGCADAEHEPVGDTAEVPFSRVLEENSGLSFEEFRKLCDEREGWAYLTASCAGSGMCRGLFLLEGTLSEQSCKGMNGCGGAGCVMLPKDSGKTPAEVLETTGCANCHGHWNDDYSEVDLSTFTLVYGPDQTEEGKLAQFEALSKDRLTSILVFGTQGLTEDGVYFSNMPAYREKLSLAEIERTVEHIISMPKLTHRYEFLGHAASESDAGAPAPTPQPEPERTNTQEADAGPSAQGSADGGTPADERDGGP